MAMQAADATRKAAQDTASWQVLQGYGMTGSATTTLPPTHDSFDAGRGPSLDFDFFLPDSQKSQVNEWPVTVYLAPILNYRPYAVHSYSLQLDDAQPLVVRPVPLATKGGPQPPSSLALAPPDVEDILRAGMRKVTTMMPVPAGKLGWHTLKLSAMQPGLVIEMVAIGPPPSNIAIPPPQSFRVVAQS